MGLFHEDGSTTPSPYWLFFKSSEHFVFCFNAQLTISDHIQARARRTALNQSAHSSDSEEPKSSSRIEPMASCPLGFLVERANYCTTNSTHGARQNMSCVASAKNIQTNKQTNKQKTRDTFYHICCGCQLPVFRDVIVFVHETSYWILCCFCHANPIFEIFDKHHAEVPVNDAERKRSGLSATYGMPDYKLQLEDWSFHGKGFCPQCPTRSHPFSAWLSMSENA